jgi:hypothetical protein
VTPLPKLGPPVHTDEQNQCFNIFRRNPHIASQAVRHNGIRPGGSAGANLLPLFDEFL